MFYNNDNTTYQKDYTSDFKVDSSVGVDDNETSVQTEDVQVDPRKQKIINDVKRISNGTFSDEVMKANKIIITSTLIGMGLGIALSIKYGKPLLVSTFIGGAMGFGVMKLYTTLK